MGQNKQVRTGRSKLYYRHRYKNRQAIRIHTDEKLNCERQNFVGRETQ